MSGRTVMQLADTLKAVTVRITDFTEQERADLREAAYLLERMAEITASNNRARQSGLNFLETR